MRIVILFALALPAAALAGDEPAEAPQAVQQAAAPAQSLDMPGYGEPVRKWESIEDAKPTPEECHDRIYQVREATGQPKLDREPAGPNDAVLIWAVDRREASCSMMVVKGDPDDIRPIPEPDGGPLFRPIQAE